jgi:hypothetical protein
MVLVMGHNRKYWPRIGHRDGKEWNIFIDKYVNPSLREVKTDWELHLAKREPYDGGTAFHLETPANDSDLMRELRVLSKEFRIYNDTFTYRVNQGPTKEILTAHTSPYCSVTWESGTLREFLEEYRFGSRHRYDPWELSEVSKNAAVVLVEESLSPGQRYALEKIPWRHCGVAFGYLPIKDEKEFVKELEKPKLPIPVLMFRTPSKCRAFHFGKVAEAHSSGFLYKAERGELCNKLYSNGTVIQDDDEQEHVDPAEDELFADPSARAGLVSGSKLFRILSAAAFAVIGLVRARAPLDNKQE